MLVMVCFASNNGILFVTTCVFKNISLLQRLIGMVFKAIDCTGLPSPKRNSLSVSSVVISFFSSGVKELSNTVSHSFPHIVAQAPVSIKALFVHSPVK